MRGDNSSEQVSDIEDRMAELAGRVGDDEKESEYASRWLDRLWRLREAVLNR